MPSSALSVWTRFRPAPDTELTLAASDRGITTVWFGTPEQGLGERRDSEPLLRETARQLQLYFEGKLRCFDIPLDLRGTPFQLDVWKALIAIPFGETRSYRDVAITVGKPDACRAVGAANGRNPIPIIVPCHRVIASDGSLAGFSSGLDYKRRLLNLERGIVPLSAAASHG